MIRRIFIATAAFLILLSAGCSGNIKTSNPPGSIKLNVVTSFYPMYDFAIKVGGDKISVTNMVPAGTEPHDWEPSTSDIVNLEKADVFIYNGMGMEGWAPGILSALQNKTLLAVEASKNIKISTDGIINDPHVWLDPEYAKLEMRNIKDAFAAADTQNAQYYESSYSKYADEFDALDNEFRETLAACPNRTIVVSHAAFGYLCAAYGLNQVAVESSDAGSEPNPARMAEIIKYILDNKIKVIFSEELISPKVIETIAAQTGAATAVLNPLEGLSEKEIAAGGEYISVMKNNLGELKKALE